MPKILVVDDDPDIIKLVQNRLEANNYRVISASDGEDGIKKAQQEKPDLIVMDIMMPHMQGGDAVRLLRADQLTKHIPIIFLSAVASNQPRAQAEESINVGGEFFTAIAKPFKPERLLFEITRLIGDV
jgi:CheY-like chemotaxis protein